MRLPHSRVSYLLGVYSSGKATTEEERELFSWVAKGNQKPIKKHIEKLVSSYNSSNEAAPSVNWEQLYQQIMEERNIQGIQPMIRKMIWIRWAAAAAILLLLGTGYYLFTATFKNQKELAGIKQTKKNDIAPPNTVNAVLTLSNGQKIVLDSTGNGMLAVQGSVNVVKLADGEIAYRGDSKKVEYNTLSNPRGSKVISLILSDGSKVWLNAGSSLRYPTAFAGKERKVDITGEAYFEVAHRPAMPFIVSKGTTGIKVLGTHFNVNAYEDESSVNVTLLEGSVSIVDSSNKIEPKVIKPGEQARVNKNGNIELDNLVDLSEVMAWKNGLFSFKGADMETIMRQVSRWYNVEVVFKKSIPEKFYAEVSRSTSVSTLLEMLEATKAVHFEIRGNTISVMP